MNEFRASSPFCPHLIDGKMCMNPVIGDVHFSGWCAQCCDKRGLVRRKPGMKKSKGKGGPSSQIMQVLVDKGPSTARVISDALPKVKKTTVCSLLSYLKKDNQLSAKKNSRGRLVYSVEQGK